MSAPTFEVLGVPVNGAPFKAVLARVLGAPESGERLAVHFATAHSMVEAHDRPEVGDALRAGLVEPDGMPLVWLGRRSRLKVERVCGPDFMPALIAAGVPLGRSHFFLGGAAGTPEALASRLRAQYPGVRIVGTLSPPFRDLTIEEDAAVVAAINAATPDYVWVGLGAPKQDLWVAAHRAQLSASALLAVGAAFDFHSRRRRRAPRWMQRTGTEWLYRLAAEPRRLAGRYTRVNARFALLLAAERRRRLREAR
jgi:N-acetylglucosaminyldiphosphoundecaprenol N-acetyl-beta-D-mannosaminyltransferase